MPKFDIFEYAVEGNNQLQDIDIERAVTPFLGEGKTLRDIDGARAALEGMYHDAGYLTVLVTIPEQDVGNGSVTLNVVEGEVDKLRVKGAEYHLASGIKDKMPELAAGKVPYFPQVQRELDALNRSADLKATPVLKPGRIPGKVEIALDVEDELPLHGSVSYDNRQSANTTPQRLSANVRYDNLWQLGHSASLTLQTSPQNSDEVRVAALTYVLPASQRGDAFALYSVISRSKFASLAGSPGLGLLGNTNIFGARYALPLPGLDNYSQSMSFGLDYKDVKQSVVLPGAVELPTPITYTPLVAAYNGSWLGKDRTTSIEATTTLGMRGLFGDSDSDFAAKRSGASAQFFALRAAVQHTVVVNRWSLSGKVEGQIASGPLVSNEQFSAGGAESVRGYLESERSGDSGFRYAFEARTPRLPFFSDTPLRMTGLAFYEGARLRTLQPVFPQTSYTSLRGTGLGLRMTGWKGMSFDLDWARALVDGDITRAGDNRLLSRLLWEY